MKKKVALLLAVVMLTASGTACEKKGTEASSDSGELSTYAIIEAPGNLDTVSPERTPEEEYVSPLDFSALKEKNPDIYAWIDIPDSDLSYPVLSHKEDDAYYLTHDSYGNYDAQGALYTETEYNSNDFEDPVTIIYGHCLTWNGVLFGSLEPNYSDKSYFDTHNKIKIYLPDKEYEYKIVAATPYSSAHLLYYYDFSVESVFNTVMKDIMETRSLQTIVDSDAKVRFGDHILILSTCLKCNDESKRFLVVAQRTE